MFKIGKIGKLVIACALIMALVMPIVGFADNQLQLNEPANKSQMLKRNMERGIVNPERKDVTKLLEVVEEYSPETLSDWEALAEERKTVLEDIHELKKDIRELREERSDKRKENNRGRFEEIKENSKTERNTLRTELAEKVRNDEITMEEAKAQLKEFIEAQKETGQAKKEEIKGKIEEWKIEKKAELEEWKEEHQDEIDKIKNHRSQVATLKEELKLAVEADDAETVKALLSELYPKIQEGNNFLVSRLELLREKYDIISTIEDVVISDML